MIEVDTNVLVRYLTKDDQLQAVEATHFLTDNSCLVLQTVLLETVWVLGSRTGHQLQRQQIIERLNKLLGLPSIVLQNPQAVSQALSWYASGMDFADALHLANSREQFATFDQRLRKKSETLNTPQNVILLGNNAE